MAKQFYIALLLLGSILLVNDLYAQNSSKESGAVNEGKPEKKSGPKNKDFQVPGPSYQFTGEKNNTGWSFYFDNDALADKDQDFTFGLALTLSGRRATEYFFSLDKPLKLLDKLVRFEKLYKRKGSFQLHSMEIGLTAFTPEDTTDPEPIKDDHPYGSLLFMVNTQQTVVPSHNASYESRLTVGILGLRLAEWAQKTFHDVLGQEKPQGWRNQISDGGELTAKYAVSGQWTIAKDYSLAGFGYELKTSAELDAGYLTGAIASISGRLGKITTPWWSFNPHQADYIHLSTPIVSPTNQSQSKEFYLFGGFNLNYILYNVFLQGQFRDSAVTFSRSEIKHVVGEAFVGITKGLPFGFSFSFLVRGRTETIKEPSAHFPVWGGLIISRAL